MQRKKLTMIRPSWDEYFALSTIAAARSSCHYLWNGSIIVKDKRIIAMGYNGAPPNTKNCLENGCRKDKYGIDFLDKGKGICRGVHAESNALAQLGREEKKGASLWTIIYPCSNCAKEIVRDGIAEVVYMKDYVEKDSLTEEIFQEARINLRKFDFDVEKACNFIRKVWKQDTREE